MPPPSNQRAAIEPPGQITTEAVKGFLTGALRFGSVSILAHMILSMPHPFTFGEKKPTNADAPKPGKVATPLQKAFQPSTKSSNTRRLYRPLESLSESLAPASRVYRGLTPQFKVFLQMAAMTLGGCVWAERRVNEYLDEIRRARRAERRQQAADASQ